MKFLGNSEFVRLTCVMNGFEAEENALPTWKTDFKDDQISTPDDGPSWLEEGNAGWNINVTVSYRDSGDKVRQT